MTKKEETAIPHSAWKWFGMAAHFICAHDCLHHLATQVGDHIISTVGNLRPSSERNGGSLPAMEEIGLNRMFETFVFRVGEGHCECGCGLPNMEPGEVDARAANTIAEADLNHIRMCEKYAKRGGAS